MGLCVYGWEHSVLVLGEKKYRPRAEGGGIGKYVGRRGDMRGHAPVARKPWRSGGSGQTRAAWRCEKRVHRRILVVGAGISGRRLHWYWYVD